jgi:hypothetical protein
MEAFMLHFGFRKLALFIPSRNVSKEAHAIQRGTNCLFGWTGMPVPLNQINNIVLRFFCLTETPLGRGGV